MGFFSLALLFRFYAYYCFACMCVYTPCECLMAMEPDEGTRSLLLQVVFRSPIAFAWDTPPSPKYSSTHTCTQTHARMCACTPRETYTHMHAYKANIYGCAPFSELFTQGSRCLLAQCDMARCCAFQNHPQARRGGSHL